MTPKAIGQYRVNCGSMVRCTEVGKHRRTCAYCRWIEARLTDAAIERAGERLRELGKQTL